MLTERKLSNTPREFGAWLDFAPVYKDFSTVDYIEYLWIEDGNDASTTGPGGDGGGAGLIIGGAGTNFAGADELWVWHHHLSG